MADATNRDEEIRLIWTENQWLYMVVGFFGGVLFCFLVQLSVLNLPELIQNLIPEATGMFVTVVIIDQLNRRRDDRNAIKQLKQQLLRDASSIVNDVANNAVHQLRKRNWLEKDNGVLAGSNLVEANLQGVDLGWTNLQKAKLVKAQLQGAKLVYANLQEAMLTMANLQEADLRNANLQAASLIATNLQGAELWKANLQGASLMMANLRGAKLEDAQLTGVYLDDKTLFDENTILPDGTNWTPQTSIMKFIQPNNHEQ